MSSALSNLLHDTVTITRPMRSHMPRGEGVIPTKTDPSISIRATADQRVTIDEAAEFLEMKRSAFIRWCAVAVANQIINQKRELARRVYR